MKNTLLKPAKVFLSFAIILMMCLSFSTMTDAASVKNIPVKKSFSADITGDGKADQILIQTTLDKYAQVQRFKITVNKKLALTKALSNQDVNYIYAKYAKMTNSKEFIQIIGIGPNDYVDFNQIYKYNNKSKKFYSVSNLDDTANEITSAKKNSLTLTHSTQPSETGWLNWKMTYRFSKNKFVLSNATTSTVRSVIGNGQKDYYSKLFQKNIFITAKKLSFYNGKKLAYSVPANTKVTLKKLTMSKDKIYLQFQYGKKTGWISVNNKNYNYESPYFKIVNSRLAG